MQQLGSWRGVAVHQKRIVRRLSPLPYRVFAFLQLIGAYVQLNATVRQRCTTRHIDHDGQVANVVRQVSEYSSPSYPSVSLNGGTLVFKLVWWADYSEIVKRGQIFLLKMWCRGIFQKVYHDNSPWHECMLSWTRFSWVNLIRPMSHLWHLAPWSRSKRGEKKFTQTLPERVIWGRWPWIWRTFLKFRPITVVYPVFTRSHSIPWGPSAPWV